MKTLALILYEMKPILLYEMKHEMGVVFHDLHLRALLPGEEAFPSLDAILDVLKVVILLWGHALCLLESTIPAEEVEP
jgi:hypothetical protein